MEITRSKAPLLEMASSSSVPAAQHSSLRRINEDSRLRPFLSPLFDSQSYIKTVIKEGKSEECFSNIVRCVDDVNIEIKGYISQHKDELMSGMQDVATLADRYVNLSAKSQKLHKNISRLKSEATESHTLVASRTSELERIHATSILLHQLKLFVHAKASLEAYTQKPDETDLRNLSGAAKTISDMEKLLCSPALLEVKCVSDYAPTVRTFGSSVRMLAQERLLAAIVEKNQAAMANSLQVFYNMDSLPEILLLVVDSTVKRTVDASRAALDVEGIHALLHEGGTHHVGGAAGLPAAAAGSVPMSASKKPSAASAAAASAGAGATGGAGGAQLRTVMREVAHVWSSMVHEMALQIHALQRVVAKKEDPATHQKFLTVLQRVRRPQDQASGPAVSADLLSRGLLLELFWHRLAEALQDVAADKVKHFGAASSRAYPFLRKAALDTLGSLRSWSEHGGGSGAGTSARTADLLKLDFSTDALTGGEDGADDADDTMTRPAGMFGSLLWSPQDLLAAAGGGRGGLRSAPALGPRSGDETQSADRAGMSLRTNDHNSVQEKEHGLIQGLRPMRDKYLVLALQRMSAPIAQMFPELEGYTAAVPSKRDLLALTKAIQAEFSNAAAEGDASLVALLCKEFLKTVRLMLSKIEGMVVHSADTRTIFSANNFARSQGQLHNANLLVLLVQFKEALQKIPSQVIAAGSDSAASLLDRESRTISDTGAAATAAAGASAAGIRALEGAVATTARLIEDLAARQIMDPVVALLSSYVTSIAVAVQKEGVISAPAPSPAPAQSPAVSGGGPGAGNPGGYTGKAPAAPGTPLDASVQDCSVAVQTLLRNLPVLLKSHVLCLPKCEAVTNATEEIYVRTLHSYVTVAALSRPVTEASRLRTTKDLAALEMMLSGLHTLSQPAACPVLRECRAFRRLLFEQESGGNPGKSASGVPATPAGKGLLSVANPVPDARELLRLPYIASLRPSTLLGYLLSCAPPQLPSPFEAMARPANANASTTTAASGDSPLVSYVDMLVDVHFGARGGKAPPADPQNPASTEGSVRGLYAEGGQGWCRVANEAQSWELVQHALDTFFQRIAVADGQQRQAMRQWYEAIMDVGSKIM